MLEIGDVAPDFEASDETGEAVTLGQLLANGPLVLYFYPADFTPGCTTEACEIRDLHEDLSDVDVQVVGVSPQTASSHMRFKNKHELPFPLLVDTRKEMIKAYGVNGPMGFGVRRVTFLIAEDRTVINRVVADVMVNNHISFIKQVITDRQASAT